MLAQIVLEVLRLIQHAIQVLMIELLLNLFEPGLRELRAEAHGTQVKRLLLVRMQGTLTAKGCVIPRFGVLKVVDALSLAFPVLLPQSIHSLSHRGKGLSLNRRFGYIIIRSDLNVQLALLADQGFQLVIH